MTNMVGQLNALNAASPAFQVSGDFNIALWGTFNATLQLQRTFDGPSATAVWLPCSISPDGTQANYTAPLSATVREPEAGVHYRWVCTAYVSGPINYRISQ